MNPETVYQFQTNHSRNFNEINLQTNKPNILNADTNSDDQTVNSFNTLSIGSLNVCGLKRRNQYPEFVELVNNFDILCLSETKLDHTDVISCEGYTFFSQPRKQNYIRKSGGIGFFVRNHVTKFVKTIDSSSEYISWIKIAKQFHNGSEDILIGAVYIPPQQSKFFSDDEYDFF